MPDIPRYYAAACQTDLPCPRDRDDIPERVGYLLGMIDRAVVGYEPFFDVKLVVFPEFAHAAPIYETAAELIERLAVPIPNDHTDRYARKARERGVYIQTESFLEVDPRWPGSVFNTTCLIGPDGLLSRYRKVNPWLPWEVHASPHDLAGYDEPLFPVVETELGRLGAAICLRLALPRGDPRAGAGRGRDPDPRLGVHGPLGRHAADGLVDAVQSGAGGREFRFRGGREPGRQGRELPAVLLAGR
jgi:predicted amidohydrolase